MVIDPGKPQILERIDPQSSHRLALGFGRIERPGAHRVEQRPERLQVRRRLLHLFGQNAPFDSAKTASVKWRVVRRPERSIL